MSRPLTLPRLTSTEAQALAALTTRGGGPLLSGLPNGQQARLHLLPLAPGEAPARATGSQRLSLEWAGGQLALDLAPWVLDRWLHMVLGVREQGELPASFRQAALGHVVEWITSRLAIAGRGAAQLTQIALAGDARPAEAPHALAVELALVDGETLPVVVHMDSLALMLVAALAQDLPAEPDLCPMDELPVALELCVGQTLLPLDQLRRLQPGGLVFMTDCFMQGEQSLLLRTALGQRRHWAVPVRLDDTTLHLLASPTTMNTTVPTPDADDTEIAWDQMPVHLSFDLGQKTISLAELRLLGAGQALSLGRPLQHGVTIRANGAVIGSGQLVDIDGQFGVLVGELRAIAADKGGE